MNKQDRKFVFALVFAQTGVLSLLIVLSPYYWMRDAKDWERIKGKIQLSELLEKQTGDMESELKVQKLKEGFENKGIGVEEVVDLKDEQ